LLNSIYSTVSPDFRLKETPFVNFFTDPELSSSLYIQDAVYRKVALFFFVSRAN